MKFVLHQYYLGQIFLIVMIFLISIFSKNLFRFPKICKQNIVKKYFAYCLHLWLSIEPFLLYILNRVVSSSNIFLRWFVSSSYRYIWSEYLREKNSNNNKLFLLISIITLSVHDTVSCYSFIAAYIHLHALPNKGSTTFRYFFLLLNLEAWNLACVCQIKIP